jgi:hypothetical protein
MAELLRTESWSPSLVIDLVAGAIDARVSPQRMALAAQSSPNGRGANHGVEDVAAAMRGAGPKVSARDQWLAWP